MMEGESGQRRIRGLMKLSDAPRGPGEKGPAKCVRMRRGQPTSVGTTHTDNSHRRGGLCRSYAEMQ